TNLPPPRRGFSFSPTQRPVNVTATVAPLGFAPIAFAQEQSPLCRNRLRPWPSEGLSTPRCSRAAAVKGRGVLHPVKGLPVVHDPAVQAQLSDRNHEHHHGAGHVHAPASFGRAFAIGIGLNVAFVAVEFVFGVLANSVSLMAD